ncbi:unnamed protein product [Adineta steineri]|uniref:Arrestin C-terminal-like domain-containing protein n=1 Tax=Adineta steineri TaxID=433720 RepID=A0A814UPG5_9BILA|nr:unnamed protein product [Adineta steineri]CAF3714717.1 unnamed protein product [Adineta steineri]
MGASESAEIRVSFDRSTLFYYSGENIIGNITFHNTHEKLALDEIFLEFIGELGYTTRETRRRHDSNGRSHTEHFTEYHRIPFTSHRIPVVRPQYGQREVTLYRGDYSWPFEFTLPQCLPPTSIPMSVAYPYVKYYMRIVLDKPWYKPNAKQIYALTIFPRVNIHQLMNAQLPVPLSQTNRKKVHLQGRLLQTGVTPGEKLSLEINLDNPKCAEIKRIEATLIQHRQIAHSQQSEVIFRMNLPDFSEFNGTNFRRTFELHLPTEYLSPTYTYSSQCPGALFTVAFHYELKLDVKVRGLFTDFKVSVPVIVGTETMSDDPPLVNRFVETIMPSAPAYDYDEPPPSYDSIITKIKQ